MIQAGTESHQNQEVAPSLWPRMEGGRVVRVEDQNISQEEVAPGQQVQGGGQRANAETLRQRERAVPTEF